MFRKSLLLGALALVASAAPALAQDHSVKIVLNEEADLLEPCMATRSNIGRIILENVNETLTELDVRGNKGLMPRLAESWEQTGSNEWRFHLRKGVKFSDGSDFDATDVKASFDRAMDKSITCETPRYFGDMTIQASVVDPYTVDFVTDPVQPILPLLMSLVTIVPSETPVKFVRQPIGTGPYKVTDWTPGQQIVLTRRDDYWGDKPEVEKATYVFRQDPAVRAAMVKTGEADIAPSISADVADDPKMDVSFLNSETVYIRLDQSMAPINDVRVRKALNLAIDRQAFIGTLVPKGTELAVAMFPPSTLGWNPDVKVPPYDPAEAKKLLAEAKADGVPVDTKLTLVARTANFPNVTEVMEAIQQQLQDVGFNVDLKFYEVAEFEKIYSKPYPTDMGPLLVTAMHDNSKGDPVFSMFFKYASDGRQSGLKDPKVDDLIAAASEATGDARAKLWSQLVKYLHDDVWADVLLFHMVDFARVGPRVNFTPSIATNAQLQLSSISFK